MLRYEHKYLVPEALLPLVRRAVTPFTRPDVHSHALPGGGAAACGYTVRSVYLDSSRLRHFFETEDGLDRRVKPRVRAYDAWHPGATAFLELKRRRGLAGCKSRVAVPCESVSRLLASAGEAVPPRAMPEDTATGLGAFLYHLRRERLRPVLLVTYEREAYVGLLEPSLRVTFDSCLRSTAFPATAHGFDDAGARRSLERRFVLEVKHDVTAGFPTWLRPFLARHGLVRQALSKYWVCATTHRLAEGASRARVLVSAGGAWR